MCSKLVCWLHYKDHVHIHKNLKKRGCHETTEVAATTLAAIRQAKIECEASALRHLLTGFFGGIIKYTMNVYISYITKIIYIFPKFKKRCCHETAEVAAPTLSGHPAR
ncbi:hypothetical protein GDO78_019548 [Eleutherodactylus coqui]|uniref:Uncharacterized protein n=1 Tax=Eleutherodactylus coqui TaxID=57060 RepID=A0A8J6BGP7_ELECQ|nr:hypothetical protein GDO78_019548 [Eleutherodactylus coqui]